VGRTALLLVLPALLLLLRCFLGSFAAAGAAAAAAVTGSVLVGWQVCSRSGPCHLHLLPSIPPLLMLMLLHL
jgi:hypothetical protein